MNEKRIEIRKIATLIRFLLFAASMILFSHTPVAAKVTLILPAPPQGFQWKEVPETEGALLVPRGWHFLKEQGGGTVACFITKKKFTPPGKYLIGVSFQAFLDNPDGSRFVKELLESVAEEYSVDMVPGGFGPFATLQVDYDLPSTAEHEAIRIVQLGLVNIRTKTAFLVMFECPVSKWRRVGPTGMTIIKNLAFSGNI